MLPLNCHPALQDFNALFPGEFRAGKLPDRIQNGSSQKSAPRLTSFHMEMTSFLDCLQVPVVPCGTSDDLIAVCYRQVDKSG